MGLNIGFIGNFVPLHSTEMDRKWTLEKLGHTVTAFQENKVTTDTIRSYLPKLDMLLYSHTHSYDLLGLTELFAECKRKGLPTVSIHLDLWAGLDRQTDIGHEATWKTEYIFMADASPEAVELYNEYKLNWFYLAPGVIERDCKMLPADKLKYPHDIIFVGSKEYHHEYPFRPQLIEFLQKEYGDRFGLYGKDGIATVRGDDLNTLYSSAKIAVGDSCFGGRPYYVSDRYYETRGRGGFLLHPHTEGIDTVGVGHYTKENLLSLKTAIDYWLEHEDEREDMRLKGFQHVKNNETYTQRMQEVLKVVFND